MEWITAFYNILNTPGGLVILFIAIGFAGYKGWWRWDREVSYRDNIILRQDQLIDRQVNVSEANTEATSTAVQIVKESRTPR